MSVVEKRSSHNHQENKVHPLNRQEKGHPPHLSLPPLHIKDEPSLRGMGAMALSDVINVTQKR